MRDLIVQSLDLSVNNVYAMASNRQNCLIIRMMGAHYRVAHSGNLLNLVFAYDLSIS